MSLRSVPSLATAIVLGLTAALPGAAEALVLEDCRLEAGPGLATVRARCGTLERPEDPGNPDGRRIGLSVAVVPALSIDARPDPVVPLAGGPGQSATNFFVAYRGAFEGLRRDRAILLVDQRGTGDSARLTCPGGEEMLAETPDPEQIGPLVRECLAALEADPRFYTTSIAVEDLEAVREALGYPELNLYGISYGTRVAQHYLRRYPQRTRTMVLDGVVPAGKVLGPEIALSAQKALDAVFTRCARDSACARAFPEIDGAFRDLLTRLESDPATVELAHPVTGETVERSFSRRDLAGAVRLLSYSPPTAALIPQLLREAAAGNLAPLTAQVLMIEATLYEELAIGMHNSVVCSEDMPYVSDRIVDREALRATYIGEAQIDALQETCRYWPRGTIDTDFREPLESDRPTLILSGEYDPVTPAAWGDETASRLGNSRHLVGPGQGHGLLPWGCTPRIVADFVETADVQALDAECIGRLGPTPFFLDFSGPRP